MKKKQKKESEQQGNPEPGAGFSACVSLVEKDKEKRTLVSRQTPYG
jgi:hypothetical protein